MIRVRFARSLLVYGLAASAGACAASVAEQPTGRAPIAAVTTQPPAETLTPLLEKALPNVKGKTFTSAIADFPPAARAVPHRHGNAFVYAYVLEGTLRSQISGEPVRTYRQGESWVEPPGAHHVLTENTSTSKPAKLLVIFISDTGAEIKVDDRPR
ncbi:quercetin dioxygenase-like cupin family protein [Nonomuraea thailandensis]|uniref:Quercetin dioxygenase-like cupin family protein n=1 Tax=Nonomuraea thailandensis TaxID=1188745 RepID=A0A9X2K100_9ACTN|nr:cupin domain-containing protein [Nonomuraea thailandensis]MCP2356408.1 quercetin dioxygenase-like cupin family protein [Nonomuraea thailandensis]